MGHAGRHPWCPSSQSLLEGGKQRLDRFYTESLYKNNIFSIFMSKINQIPFLAFGAVNKLGVKNILALRKEHRHLERLCARQHGGLLIIGRWDSMKWDILAYSSLETLGEEKAEQTITSCLLCKVLRKGKKKTTGWVPTCTRSGSGVGQQELVDPCWLCPGVWKQGELSEKGWSELPTSSTTSSSVTVFWSSTSEPTLYKQVPSLCLCFINFVALCTAGRMWLAAWLSTPSDPPASLGRFSLHSA